MTLALMQPHVARHRSALHCAVPPGPCPAPPPPSLLPPTPLTATVVDGRRVKALHCLGCGGYACTLDGVKTDGPFSRTPVAIKQVALDRRAAERFEAAEMRGLQAVGARPHARIVRYLGMFRGDEGGGRTRLSFVFERCPTADPFLVEAETSERGFLVPIEGRLHQPRRTGCDLVSNPLKPAPLTTREARWVVAQLLEAVAHLHAQTPPVIHRDVKPDNVLVWGVDAVDAGTGETLMGIKLTDYGTVGGGRQGQARLACTTSWLRHGV